MDLSPLGRAALAAREGCRLRAYRDSVGVWTIGRGHTSTAGPPVVTEGMTLTQAEADALFAADLTPYVAAVRAALAKPVPQPFFDACCSLCFNIGQPNFAQSGVVRLANAGDLQQAADAFLLWDRPAAIRARRQGERDQAALSAYGLVYARRGDPAPVRATGGSAPAAPTRPDPLAPVTGAAEAASESWWLRLRDAIRHNMQTGA
ncbi:lysozyme [Methylobacterium sp. 092160098-2]|uniref:lysozyme n=1 Tax=unclassified Methylobacterium TaxID=2615210 RepID=UPI002381C2B6|nr:lysozyme [Methylobacterium sp. 092160098-2]MDE4909950.1 lysozyme [Methylobacterium sp. 092160098-2]